MRNVLIILAVFILSAVRGSADDTAVLMPQNGSSGARVPKIEVKPGLALELNEKVINYGLYSLKNGMTFPEKTVYHEDYKSVNAIDPVKQSDSVSYYPGLRGPNQLVIYTPAYGLRTGTNEFGTEAVVENNMVVRLNGADSVIPPNGFVISGHGKSKTWINKNIQVGSKVYIDYINGAIKVFLTPESLVYAAKEKLKQVNGLLQYYKDTDILYNDKKASQSLEESKDYLRKAEKKPAKTQEYITEAMSSLDNAIKNAIPYYNDELKGVWIRPVETNPVDIRKTLDRISSSGITDIFLETYFHGKTIYPSKYMRNYGVIWQRSEFAGFDPLEVWIEEAHKRNIKVHIWFETFYVGNDNPQMTPNHVLSVYPMWSNKRYSAFDSEVPVPSLSEHNGYFLDPANPQVREYLLGILSEIVEKYKPDGINLDYIRYPQTVDASYSNYIASNWGYTQFARNEFGYIYGIDPIDIKYGTPEWDMWALYRQDKVSSFVHDVKELVKPYNIMLTAVIFPDLKKCKSTKMQNWRYWAQNNYVDGLTPLLLTGDQNTAVLLLKDVVKNTGSNIKLYPGLFVTFMGGTFDELLMQIQRTREFKTQGAVIFDYAHLNDVYIDALVTRTFNKSYDKVNKVKEKKTHSTAIRSIKTSGNYKPVVRYNDAGRRK